jgi:hypothetical protein
MEDKGAKPTGASTCTVVLIKDLNIPDIIRSDTI